MKRAKALFTCQGCGSNKLTVTYAYTLFEYFTNTLSCTCHRSEIGVAAEKRYHRANSYIEVGPLDDDHHWNYRYKEPVEEAIYQENSYTVGCPGCLERAKDSQWRTINDGAEIDDASVEYYVNCSGCNREIEFGWSHSNRVGRIWPVECYDFEPGKYWPEPRYRHAWASRDWLKAPVSRL